LPETPDARVATVVETPSEPSRLFDLSARAAGSLALASVAVILLGSLATATAYTGYAGEGYSPLNHFISELGETTASRLALVFNSGLVIGGAGLGSFLMILARYVTGRYRPALMLAGAVAGLSGILVGIFPMDTHAAHRVVSGMFFCTGWIVVSIFSLWLVRRRPASFPTVLLLPGAVSIATFVTFLAVYSTYRPLDPNAHILARPALWKVPLLEWASLLSLLFWFACVAISLIRRRAD
jgi:hypothetical membrane protein